MGLSDSYDVRISGQPDTARRGGRDYHQSG